MEDPPESSPAVRPNPRAGDDVTVISGRAAVGSAEEASAAGGSTVPRATDGRGTTAEIGRLLEGTMLGPYRLDRFIGGGGMGAVFQALDTTLDRTVAVKVLARRQSDDEETLRRFRNEAQSAARLDHDNIGRVHAVGSEGDWHFIVFEYIEGTNIRDLVREEGPFDPGRTVDIAIQVAEALEHASERDVVHRDIKPSNIVITPAGRARIVDMGLARLHQVAGDGDLTVSGMTLGTFDYISPEQARDPRAADVRSDLYSLGCTMFFMLAGRPPFAEGTMVQKLLQHQQAEPPGIDEIRADVPRRLASMIGRLMAKDPADRYQRPAVLAADLAALAETEGYPISGGRLLAGSSPPARRVPARLPWLMPLAVFAVLVGGLWFRSAAVRRQAVGDPAGGSSQDVPLPPVAVRLVAAPAGQAECGTLEEALARIGPEGVIDIDLDGEVEAAALDLTERRVTIRAAAGRRPLLAIEPGADGVAVAVGAGQLVLEDLAVRPGVTSAAFCRSLFSLSTGNLVCRRTVLMMPEDQFDSAAAETAAAFVTVTASPAGTAAVILENVRAAGDATFAEIVAAAGGRAELRWSGGELATSRRLLLAEGSSEPPGPTIDCRLSDLTALCGRGVVALRDSPGQPASAQLRAEAAGCRFVVPDAARPVIEQAGIGLPEAYRGLLSWNDLQSRYEGSPIFLRIDGAAERVETGFGDSAAPPEHDPSIGPLPSPATWEGWAN